MPFVLSSSSYFRGASISSTAGGRTSSRTISVVSAFLFAQTGSGTRGTVQANKRQYFSKAFARKPPLLAPIVSSTFVNKNKNNNQRSFSGSSHSMTAASPSTSVAGTKTAKPPPVARRDEDAVFYAGSAPPGWDMKLPRQAENSPEALIDPPIAIPNPYGWIRDDDRTNSEVLELLKAENEYTTSVTSHLEELRTKLYTEMLSSIQETDYTTPRPRGDYYYYTRTYKGKSYTTHCRAPRKDGEAGLQIDWDGTAETSILPGEEITLDLNVLAKDQSYCSPGSVVFSPSQRYLAYAIDYKGDETCRMWIVDTHTKDDSSSATGQHVVIDHDPELAISGSIRWGFNEDNPTVFYLKQDAAKRPYQVYKRYVNIGNDMTPADQKDDEMILEELDDLYWAGIYKSLDGKYLFVETSSKETTAIHYLDLETPDAKLKCVAPKRSKVLYEVSYRNGYWWIPSNVGGLPNMALFKSPVNNHDDNNGHTQDTWELVTGPDGEVLFDGGLDRALDSVTCFKNHVVFSGREGGIPRIWVSKVDDNNNVLSFERLAFDETAYDVGLGTHHEFDTDKLVVHYDSLITPPSSIEIDMNDTTKRTVLKTKAVPGYDKSLYDCERTTVLSRDGKTEIPVSIVYRKDAMEKHLSTGEPAHVHLYGYGSYGSCMEASFGATRLTLLNRGIVYVIAHVRGGGEMGRQWYEEPNGAKYLCKKNTFNDFVDVSNWLIKGRKLAAPEKLSCEGRSAGGLLIGASINQAPENFKCAILGVPFVDVVNTMTDASIPLTTGEWEEWGNPNEQKFHQYMMEYCPMQNIEEEAQYPAILCTGGLHDPRVQFWEPTKYVATLRHKSPETKACLKMDMSAGHFSASDRYKYYKELSFDFAFLLDNVGLAD